MKPLNPPLEFEGRFSRLAAAIIFAGAALRIVFWQVHLPIWKHFAAFTLLEMPVFQYLGNFQSYSAVRMPFYDLFAAVSYLTTRSVFGFRSLTFFSIAMSILSLPFFYLAVKELFDERIAHYALTLYAFYPKFLVLSGQGFPEASAVAFISISLYALARARTEGEPWRVGWSLGGGVLATLAYLMFVPAVLYGVIVTVFLYLTHDYDEGSGVGRLLPSIPSVTFAAVPSIVGILYVMYGPILSMATTVTGGWTNMSTSLFRPETSYPLTEKVLRYVAYIYMDIWSFGRGYDKGHHVVEKLHSFSTFTGDAFPFLIAGYLGITLLLTGIVCYGVLRLFDRRDGLSMLVLIWIGSFFALHTIKNFGWTGVFQTRHVFPYFPAAAIAFGVGTGRLHVRLRGTDVLPQFDRRDHLVMAVVLLLCFVPLIAVSTVDGVYSGSHHKLEAIEPNVHLQAVTGPSDQVAVVTIDEYRDTILYSGGEIRPVILIPDESRLVEVETWTTIADTRIVQPSKLSVVDADYLIITECGDLDQMQRSYLEAGIKRGDVVYSSFQPRGSGRCDVQSHIIEISG
jgi:4-amino-4-deoxy-L-arabinose transferase-like glycosyltransferase